MTKEVAIYFLNKYKYYLILIILLFISLYFNLFSKEEINEVETFVLDEVEETVEEVVLNLTVDIKGAVVNPGVYQLSNDSRVSDAIKISGGLTKEADTSSINLSKNLLDEMVIIIYTKAEIAEMKKGNTSIKYVDKECICPKITNDACVSNPVTNKPEENDKSSSLININTAGLTELMSLSGIGESKAKAIVEYRKINGNFKTTEDIMNVSGIGTAVFEKIKTSITI